MDNHEILNNLSDDIIKDLDIEKQEASALAHEQHFAKENYMKLKKNKLNYLKKSQIII